jgi:hypothetical protein
VEPKGRAVVAAEWLVDVLTAHGALGVLFAIAFVTKGISRVDPVAKGSRAGFRLIVFPGAAALWPLLLVRWIRESRTRI